MEGGGGGQGDTSNGEGDYFSCDSDQESQSGVGPVPTAIRQGQDVMGNIVRGTGAPNVS